MVAQLVHLLLNAVEMQFFAVLKEAVVHIAQQGNTIALPVSLQAQHPYQINLHQLRQ